MTKKTGEIPWPADPATLPRDEHGQIVVGRFVVWEAGLGTWGYSERDGNGEVTGFESAYDAVNEGALCDDYLGRD